MPDNPPPPAGTAAVPDVPESPPGATEGNEQCELRRSDGRRLRRPRPGDALVALLAGVIVLGAGWYVGRPTDSADSRSITLLSQPSGPAPRVGEPAPDFRLVGFDGATVQLSELRGRPVWITFWATWCPPCRAEAPEIQATHERYGDVLVILAVNIGQDPDTVMGYTERTGVTFPVLFDATTEVAARYRVRGIPTHFFIDADGILRDWKIGGMNQKEMDRRLATVLE